jgi:hypothetical protein
MNISPARTAAASKADCLLTNLPWSSMTKANLLLLSALHDSNVGPSRYKLDALTN